MFAINQIKEAHSKVKSGADFPKYIQDLFQLGILKYRTYVSDGHSEFAGTDNYILTSDAKYDSLLIAEESSQEQLQQYLRNISSGNQIIWLSVSKQPKPELKNGQLI